MGGEFDTGMQSAVAHPPEFEMTVTQAIE